MEHILRSLTSLVNSQKNKHTPKMVGEMPQPDVLSNVRKKGKRHFL